jgi:hypothetical protein
LNYAKKRGAFDLTQCLWVQNFRRERREQTPHSTQRERKKSEQAKEVSAREARANTAFNTKRKKEKRASEGSFGARSESKQRIQHKEKERNGEQANEIST